MPKKREKKTETKADADEKAHEETKDNGDEASPSTALHHPVDIQQAVALAKHLQQLTVGTSGSAAKDLSEAKSHDYAFWKTQPVPKFDEKANESTFIEPSIPVEEVRSEPFSLPDVFQWSDVNLHDATELRELYTLLTENYVEDDDNMFRFDYSPEFLQWALLAPGWFPEWHCGVRAKTSGRLVAFISAVPQHLRVFDKTVSMVEINFLCVHKRLRSKRVAPVLIREITRRVNKRGIFQAAFTAGIVIPKPVSVCRYYHRSLNPKKLIDVRFSHLGSKMTLQRTIKLYRLPERPATENLRPLEERDVDGAFALLSKHLERYKLAPVFSRDEFAHFFIPRPDVIFSYVVETGGKVTDMVSFYCLPSSVMQHPTHKNIRAAYLYYHVAGSVPLKQLLNDALILAHEAGFDVFNALDLMDNKTVLEELKFGIGDGNLQYYLYNWKCPDVAPEEIGLVLQ